MAAITQDRLVGVMAALTPETRAKVADELREYLRDEDDVVVKHALDACAQATAEHEALHVTAT